MSDGVFIYDVPLTPGVDLSNASVSMSVYCASAVGIGIQWYVTTDGFSGTDTEAFLHRADGWQVLTMDTRSLEQSATGMSILLIPLDYVEPPPNLSIYIDWIRVSDGSAGPWEFAVNGNPIAPDVSASDGVPVVDWRGP